LRGKERKERKRKEKRKREEKRGRGKDLPMIPNFFIRSISSMIKFRFSPLPIWVNLRLIVKSFSNMNQSMLKKGGEMEKEKVKQKIKNK